MASIYANNSIKMLISSETQVDYECMCDYLGAHNHVVGGGEGMMRYIYIYMLGLLEFIQPNWTSGPNAYN